ncbi:hypothetical protein ACLD0W_10820 [Alloalcanivorax sp. C16-1]|uniref:hypothetical protein n=1 Tax=Alloalcanivorax sp. C16-1 TaxID=3390051 RepID=UPI003970F1C9
MTDYLGMWYRARARHGIDDTIHFAVIEPATGRRHEFPVRHRDHDGIGGLFHLLRGWRVPLPPMPVSRQAAPPPFWHWLRALPGRREATPPAPPWRAFPASDEPATVASACLSRAHTFALRQRARDQSLSLNAVLLTALHQAVTDTLLRAPVAGRWLYPVNMRGAVRGERDDQNLSSGFYVTARPEDGPVDLDRRVRDGLRAQRHWRFWHGARVGRWVGQGGVNWLCDRFLAGSPKLGSFTCLGEWRLDLAAAGFPPDALLTLCGPGSPNHPVSNGAMIVNDRLTLSLKLDPSLGAGADTTRACLAAWRDRLERSA